MELWFTLLETPLVLLVLLLICVEDDTVEIAAEAFCAAAIISALLISVVIYALAIACLAAISALLDDISM